MPSEMKKWKARRFSVANSRGPIGHWEISTDEQDGNDQCVVQCIFRSQIAERIVRLHNEEVDTWEQIGRNSYAKIS